MTLAFYYIFVQVSILIPAYGWMHLVFRNRKSVAFKILCAYALSLGIFGIFGILGYIFPSSVPYLSVVHWLALIGGLTLFLKLKLYKQLWEFRLPFFFLLALPLLSLAFIQIRPATGTSFYPDPAKRDDRNYAVLTVKVINFAHTPANDNYIPYRQAQFIVNGSNPSRDSFIAEWGVHFFQRTPMMGAVTAQYFQLFRDRPPIDYTWSQSATDPDHTYIKFQIIASILNYLFLLPAYLLILRLFNLRTAKLSLILISVSQYFLFNDFYTWPKSLVAFFILASWWFIFERRYSATLIAGLMSGLAYLSHDLAVLYLGSTVMLLLVQRRMREIIILLSLTTALMLPWIFTAGNIFKLPSSFYLYPLSVHDIPQPQDKTAVIREFFHTPFWELIWIRIQSLIYLLTPYQLFGLEPQKDWLVRLWSVGLYSLPGAIGLGLSPFALIEMFKRRLITVHILWLTPVILCTIVIGWPRGLGALHFAQASVAILIGLAANLLVRINYRWVQLVFYASILQLSYFAAFTLDFAIRWPSVRNTVLIAFILLLLAAFVFILNRQLASIRKPSDPPTDSNNQKIAI